MLRRYGRANVLIAVFVWLFHRITGVLLIFLIAAKIISGYAMSGRIFPPAVVYALHTGGLLSLTIDVALIFFFIFHSLYGIRSILIDLGIKREKALFWGLSGAGVVFFALAILFIYILPGQA